MVLIICRQEDLIALTSAIARSYPTYSRRTSIKKSKQLQIEFMVIDSAQHKSNLNQIINQTEFELTGPKYLPVKHIGKQIGNIKMKYKMNITI